MANWALPRKSVIHQFALHVLINCKTGSEGMCYKQFIKHFTVRYGWMFFTIRSASLKYCTAREHIKPYYTLTCSPRYKYSCKWLQPWADPRGTYLACSFTNMAASPHGAVLIYRCNRTASRSRAFPGRAWVKRDVTSPAWAWNRSNWRWRYRTRPRRATTSAWESFTVVPSRRRWSPLMHLQRQKSHWEISTQITRSNDRGPVLQNPITQRPIRSKLSCQIFFSEYETDSLPKCLNYNAEYKMNGPSFSLFKLVLVAGSDIEKTFTNPGLA